MGIGDGDGGARLFLRVRFGIDDDSSSSFGFARRLVPLPESCVARSNSPALWFLRDVVDERGEDEWLTIRLDRECVVLSP